MLSSSASSASSCADHKGATFNVTKRERNGVVHPLFEIRTGIWRDVFDTIKSVRVAIRNGRIVVTANHMAAKIRERVARLFNKLRTGAELTVFSLFHGSGVMDKAMHQGMALSGVKTFSQAVVEMRSNYLDASLRNNPELWRDESVAICGDIREIDWRNSPVACEVLSAGLPCTGMCNAGRAKNKLDCGEDHPTAGTLFIDLEAVQAVNLSIIDLECVPELQNSASMVVIRSRLELLGYDSHEVVLSAADFGALENRQRLIVVGISKGLPRWLRPRRAASGQVQRGVHQRRAGAHRGRFAPLENLQLPCRKGCSRHGREKGLRSPTVNRR